MRGHVAVTDLADYGLDLPVDSDAYNSVGGFVFAELGRLPRRGDTVNADGFSIRVESVRENRVEAVRIRERRPVPPREGREKREPYTRGAPLGHLSTAGDYTRPGRRAAIVSSIRSPVRSMARLNSLSQMPA